jgi:PadR family transcriptional regulator PadR
MKKVQTDLLQGTLDLLVLKTVQTGPSHGWDIAQRIHQVSQDVLRIGQGSLYPSLYRLEAQGWISSE